MEENEKLKALLMQKEGESKDALETSKRAAQELFAEKQKLQKQKAELLSGFKKQAQLIEVLKRQRVTIS